MARIRSVKPEFWTDPDVVSLPPLARLLFIGCWNHADDYGVLKDDPAELKLRILPADDVDAFELVDLLVERDLVLRRKAEDGTAVLVIRTFTVHQKIDKRSCGRWGHPDTFTTIPADSPPIPTNPADPQPDATDPHPGLSSFGFGTDGTGTDSLQPLSNSDSSEALVLTEPPSPLATDPVTAVFEAWKESVGKTGRTVLTPERRRLIAKQLKHYPVEDLVDAVRGWRHSAHHRGENDRHTVYNDLELLLRDAKRIESFRDLERDPPGRPLPRGMDGIAAWLSRAS